MDGGYYAIKGFEYQIDKTILEIFNSDNEEKFFGIEKIQDVNSDTWVMQIKYRETKDFVPSAVRLPILQLIEEYIDNSERSYYLYAFFKSLNGYDSYFSNFELSHLDKILHNDKDRYSEIHKKEFIKKFKLINASTFQTQFEDIILRIQREFNKDEEEAIIYYSLITDFLRKLVIENKSKTDRICNKKNFLEIINNSKKIIFNSSYREFRGEREYFKYIKKKFFTYVNIDFWERFIIIDLKGNEKIFEIKNILLKLKTKFYKEYKNTVKSGAPYILLQNITEQKLKDIKTELFNENCIFKDGYDFKNADFSIKAITQETTKENKISLKFVDSKEHLEEIMDANLETPKEIYQFYITDIYIKDSNLKNTSIKINEISDILEMI